MEEMNLVRIINSTGFLAVTTLVINTVGWFVIYKLNVNKQEKALKDEVRLDIYKKLAETKKDVDDSRNKLGMLLSKHGLPFLDMKWAQKRIETDGLSGDSPNKIYLQHVRELSEAKYKFTTDYLKLWREINFWIGVMPELKKPYKILMEQLTELNDELFEYHDYLQSIQTEEGYDWQSWPQEGIESRADEIGQEFDSITAYLDDFMTLAHNELLSPIVGDEKRLREEFRPDNEQTYSVLTKDGIKNKTLSPDEGQQSD